MDRVPLEQPEGDEAPPTEQGPMSGSGKGESPNEFYDKMDMSVMMGFEDNHFEGMGKEADNVYKWAEGDVGRVHELIKGLGITSKGKDLLRRLNQWVSFDTQQKELEERKNRLI